MKPILLALGPITIYAWGFFFSLGFVIALFVALRLARRRGLNEDRIFDMILILVVSGLLGARVLHVLLNLSLYAGAGALQYIAFWDGGLSWYGGFIAAVLAGWLYTRFAGLNFMAAADVIAPPLSLAYAIVRIGCFFAGCCYGHETALPIGVTFPGLVGPRHPTQLYSSVIGFVIFFVLLGAYRRQRFTGQIFLEYLTYYSIYRFVIEFFREDSALIGPFTITQPLAFVGALVGGALLYFFARRARVAVAQPGGGTDGPNV